MFVKKTKKQTNKQTNKKKLNVGFYAFVTVATFLKRGMIITTINLYPYVPLFMTFNFYLGHRGSKLVKWAVSLSQELLIS